jgi:hypothetical protein
MLQPTLPDFMNTHLNRLLERRAHWVAHAHYQRDAVALHAQQFVVPTLTHMDRLRDAVWWLRQRPWLVAGAVCTVAVLRPRRTWRWLRRGWSLWRLWQRGQAMWAEQRRALSWRLFQTPTIFQDK